MLALVTAASAVDLDTDLPLLVAELPEASVEVWDDPSVDWSRFDAVVIRSTWDYHRRRDDFLAWARSTATLAPLWNPIELVEWNTDKRYLAALAEQGVPTVPSWFCGPGEPIGHDLDGDIVVKPSVGAGSNGVVRVHGDAPAAIEHIGRLHRGGLTAMVQPYLARVDDCGETALVYLGGEFSHAVGKDAILAAPVVSETGLAADENVAPRRASDAERELGDLVMATLPDTAYARIDLLPGADGPVVLEVELTEPSLFLECDRGSAARAAAVFRSLAR